MLHTKLQGHLPFDSGEEDFKSVIIIPVYGHGGHLDHVTQMWRKKLPSPLRMEAP